MEKGKVLELLLYGYRLCYLVLLVVFQKPVGSIWIPLDPFGPFRVHLHSTLSLLNPAKPTYSKLNYVLFSCDSSSICLHVGRLVGRSVCLSVSRSICLLVISNENQEVFKSY